MLDRKIPPIARSISSFGFIRANHAKLQNGIPVHMIHAGQHDIIRIEIILKSGRWYERKNGAAYFASQMLLEGTSNKTARDLADIFEFNGAHVSVHSGIDYNNLVAYVVNARFSEIIHILKDCLLNSIFPDKELHIMKDIQRQQLRINNEKNNYVAGREIRKLLFGTAHPYGRSLEIEDIDQRISQDLLKGYYEQQLLHGPELIISGNLSDGLIEGLQIFSALENVLPEEKQLGIGDSGKSETIIPRKESLQSSIRWGRRIVHKTHPDFIGLLILNEIFGGFFGSRLMKNIREAKGYTYGIHSSILTHLQDSLWVVGTDVKKEFVSDTMAQIHLEADRLREMPVKDEELTLVKNYLMGNFLSSLETSFSLADKFKNIHFYGLDYSYYDRYLDALHSISPYDIQALADKYLATTAFKTVLVG